MEDVLVSNLSVVLHSRQPMSLLPLQNIKACNTIPEGYYNPRNLSQERSFWPEDRLQSGTHPELDPFCGNDLQYQIHQQRSLDKQDMDITFWNNQRMPFRRRTDIEESVAAKDQTEHSRILCRIYASEPT